MADILRLFYGCLCRRLTGVLNAKRDCNGSTAENAAHD